MSTVAPRKESSKKDSRSAPEDYSPGKSHPQAAFILLPWPLSADGDATMRKDEVAFLMAYHMEG